MLQKRGQVTIFIIIGIILLFSSALIFYIRGQISTIQGTELSKFVDEAPISGDPVETFVRDCLEKVTIQGIRKIGMQGGYLDYQEAGFKYDRNRPLQSSLLKVSPRSDLYVPFWYHMPANDKCTDDCYFKELSPKLTRIEGANSVEEQLEDLISADISVCLNEFRVFQNQGYTVTEAGLPVTDLVIAARDVAVKLNYPLTFEKEEHTDSYKEFIVRIPFNLRDPFRLGRLVLETQMDMQLFESTALNTISAFKGDPPNGLPPIYDFSFGSGSYPIWMKSDVQKKIQQILMAHIPMIQFMGTRNYYRSEISNVMMQGVTNKMIVVQNESFPRYNLDFAYLAWWPTYLDVDPSSGQTIKPTTLSGGPIASILPGFGINEYKFSYDLAFPVMVTIEYPEALFGKGFTLAFAIEANLKDNRGLNVSSRSLSFVGGETLVCSEEAHNSGNITFVVSDGITGEPIPDAVISFTFGNEGCQLGQTVIVANGSAVLTTKMPVGIGTLIVEPQDDYPSVGRILSIGINQTKEVEIKIFPPHEVELDVFKVPYVKTIDISGDEIETSWDLWISTTRPLGVRDEVILMYERIPSSPFEESFTGTLTLGANSTPPYTIDLVPGNYTVSATLLNYKKFEIPESEECHDEGGFLGIGATEECTPIDGMTMQMLNYGAIYFTPDVDMNTTWEVDYDVYDYEAVTFYIPYVDYHSIPMEYRVLDDLDKMDILQDLNKNYRDDFEPLLT